MPLSFATRARAQEKSPTYHDFQEPERTLLLSSGLLDCSRQDRFVQKKRLYPLDCLLCHFGNQLAPQFFMAAAQLRPKRRKLPYRMRTVGLQLRRHGCGPDHLTISLGLNWALTLSGLFPSKSSQNLRFVHSINECLVVVNVEQTPVDPAGPHCYRDGTKTC